MPFQLPPEYLHLNMQVTTKLNKSQSDLITYLLQQTAPVISNLFYELHFYQLIRIDVMVSPLKLPP